MERVNSKEIIYKISSAKLFIKSNIGNSLNAPSKEIVNYV